MADVKFGSSDPSTFYFGSDEVSKLYLGSNEVWSSSGETTLDTYTLPGSRWIWRSSNNWWNNLNSGSWSSTGTASGTYLTLDAGSQIRSSFIQFSANDAGGWPSDARVRITVSPSSGGPSYALEGAAATTGDSRWYYRDSSDNVLILTTAQFEEGGTFGWDSTDSVTIELFTP